jgi:hypothetical protein
VPEAWLVRQWVKPACPLRPTDRRVFWVVAESRGAQSFFQALDLRARGPLSDRGVVPMQSKSRTRAREHPGNGRSKRGSRPAHRFVGTVDLAWPAVRAELYREYEAHDGYLPHHAERELAPRLAVKPASLRTRFTNDLRELCAAFGTYALTADDVVLLKGMASASACYRRLLEAGRSLPPFGAFVYALWRAVDPRSLDVGAAMRSCTQCRGDWPARNSS